MPDFDRDDDHAGESKALEVKRYCYNDHDEYWRDGIYVRARGLIAVQHANGTAVYLCGRCYYEWLDRRGLSVMAQLRRYPDSVVSVVEAQLQRDREEW